MSNAARPVNAIEPIVTSPKRIGSAQAARMVADAQGKADATAQLLMALATDTFTPAGCRMFASAARTHGLTEIADSATPLANVTEIIAELESTLSNLDLAVQKTEHEQVAAHGKAVRLANKLGESSETLAKSSLIKRWAAAAGPVAAVVVHQVWKRNYYVLAAGYAAGFLGSAHFDSMRAKKGHEQAQKLKAETQAFAERLKGYQSARAELVGKLQELQDKRKALATVMPKIHGLEPTKTNALALAVSRVQACEDEKELLGSMVALVDGMRALLKPMGVELKDLLVRAAKQAAASEKELDRAKRDVLSVAVSLMMMKPIGMGTVWVSRAVEDKDIQAILDALGMQADGLVSWLLSRRKKPKLLP